MTLVQISKRRGRIDRVPRGEVPVIELHLSDWQQVTQLQLEEAYLSNRSERKTVDWYWSCFVITRLEGTEDADDYAVSSGRDLAELDAIAQEHRA